MVCFDKEKHLIQKEKHMSNYLKKILFSLLILVLPYMNSAPKAMVIDGIEFKRGGNVKVKNNAVYGQNKGDHYQLKSKRFPVPPTYSVRFEIEVGTDPTGKNSTPVGVGILSGDEKIWVALPGNKTYNSQLGIQSGEIIMNNNHQSHAVLVLTNQGQNQALANFKVRSVKFVDTVNNRFLN